MAIQTQQSEWARKNENGLLVWKISWERANLQMLDGNQSGNMWDVKGSTYGDKGEVASTFQAKTAEAGKKDGQDELDQLNLSGGVTVKSAVKKVTLTAKKVEWLPGQKLYRAIGDVIVEGENGVVGPANELFMTPKLDKIASSRDYFKK